MEHIKSGSIKNPNHPSVYGTGYFGNGFYKAEMKSYTVWQDMLRRAYSQKYQDRNPTYKYVTVCKEWHNFQVFAAWFEDNHIEGFHLDKDILKRGNKVYSSGACCWVPVEINSMLTKTDSKRGEYPIGVTKVRKRFKASVTINNVSVHLGTFDTFKEAFLTYKTTKEEYIKEVAEKWKPFIKPQTYQALINYNVEITD